MAGGPAATSGASSGDDVDLRPGPVRGDLPGRRAGARAAARPARGAAAHPDRQREPGASGRCASSSTIGSLREGTRYDEVIAGLERSFAAGPAMELADGTRTSLVELLRAPARHVPTSLAGQLRYVREHWGSILGADLDALIGRLDIAIGVLAEEEHGLHQRFGGGGGGKDRPPDVPVVHRRRRRGAGGLLERFGVDAAGRAHGQEHVRLARPAVAPVRRATCGRSTRSPTRSSTGSRAGA